MAQVIVMPRFGATMEEGTINSWYVKEGDVVSKGDLLGEISIEKLTNELLAEEDGVILKLIAEEGATLACGEPILIIGQPGESPDMPADLPAHKQENFAAASLESHEPLAGQASRIQTQTREYSESAQITPKALQLAQELGVDYHFIRGSGRFGMITREDVRNAAAAESAAEPKADSIPAALSSETQKMSPMQSSIARAMEASLKATAQTTISMDLDAEALVKAYKAKKEEYRQENIQLTYTAILVKIVALALVEHKLLRTVIEGANLVTRGEINIGIAIDIPEGLIVPNIKNAHQKTIRQIAHELSDLGTRARENGLIAEEITGGTFTISNLGPFGIKYFTPVLNTGESGILGVGVIQEVPYIKDGGIYVKPTLNLSLTHDHRVVNGAPAARFLGTVQQIMNDCEGLLAK